MGKKTQESIDLQTIVNCMPNYLNNEVIPTNICILDNLLGGGLEVGSSLQLVGESGTGKSTITLLMAKKICEQGKNVVYIDTENSISKEMIISLGLEQFMRNECYRFFYYRLSTFSSLEKELDKIISIGKISLVVIDSIAGLLNDCFINLEKKKSITEATSSYNSRPLSLRNSEI